MANRVNEMEPAAKPMNASPCGRKNVRPYNSPPIVSRGTCGRRFAARLRHVINGVFRMKKFLLFAILSLAASGCMSKTVMARKEKKPPFPSATPEAVTAVTDAVFPSVVRIDVKQEHYAEGKRKLQSGIGSGVIIDDQGR